MNLLLVGGSGLVGTAITPYLQQHYRLRVLDLEPPQHDAVEYVHGSIADANCVRQALHGMDAFISMVMKSGQGGHERHHTVEQAIDNYTVNCLGHHLLLYTACELGITQGIYTSTMSVHNRKRKWYPSEDEIPLDGPDVYGLTKGFTEGVCQYFSREYDMNLLIYRITGPCSRSMFIDRIKRPPAGVKLYYTDEEDLANAYLAGLKFLHTGHRGCEVFFISGDENHEEMDMGKARLLLGWEPVSRKRLGI